MRQTVVVLLELLRVGHCSTRLLLLLDLRKHLLLLMLWRVHYPTTTSSPSSSWNLLELMMKGKLGRHPSWLLLHSRTRTHSLLRDWRH